jgi:hypothetical protein
MLKMPLTAANQKPHLLIFTNELKNADLWEPVAITFAIFHKAYQPSILDWAYQQEVGVNNH